MSFDLFEGIEFLIKSVVWREWQKLFILIILNLFKCGVDFKIVRY